MNGIDGIDGEDPPVCAQPPCEDGHRDAVRARPQYGDQDGQSAAVERRPPNGDKKRAGSTPRGPVFAECVLSADHKRRDRTLQGVNGVCEQRFG